MYEEKIKMLKKSVTVHIVLQLCFIICLILFSIISKIFIYIFVVIFLAENTYFNFKVLKCPRCGKLLRNPFKPRFSHLPEKCNHCQLKIM